MELEKALLQLSEIHAQVYKTEIYRGLKAFPVALTGILGLLGGGMQNLWVAPWDAAGFTLYWSAIATLGLLMVSTFLAHNHLFRESVLEWRKARSVLMQFMPAVFAGALLTVAAYQAGGEILWYLSGLWSLIFALGIFACRPYFPARSFWLGIYYLLAAALLLSLAPRHLSLHPWGMGLIFGIGQLLAAAFIYWNLEHE